MAAPEFISSSPLHPETVGVWFQQFFEIAGNSPFEITSLSPLPQGLELDSYELRGTPEVAGDYVFTLKATNNEGSDTKDFELLIGVPPVVLTQELPEAEAFTYYDFQLEATGTDPIVWTDMYDELPDYMTISEDGRIFGELREDTVFITALATSAHGSDYRSLSINVTTEPPLITNLSTGQLPDGIIFTDYEFQLEATGTKPIIWTKGDDWPEFLTLTEDGKISGYLNELAYGYSYSSVVATNAYGVDSRGFVLFIDYTPAFRDPIITTESLDPAFIGLDYNFKVEALDPVKYSWFLPEAPSGFTIGIDSGVIEASNVALAAGNYNISVLCDNDVGSLWKDFTLTVKSGDDPSVDDGDELWWSIYGPIIPGLMS